MMKPNFLYHGSVRKFKGNKLVPKKAQDLEEKPENIHRAIYATNIKEIAISMAIISSKGVNDSSLCFTKKPYGIIYKGWPKQKYIYLYTLLPDNFKKTKNKKQWISSKPIKPIKVERLIIKNYLHFIKKATEKQKKNWFKKYNNKIKKIKGYIRVYSSVLSYLIL